MPINESIEYFPLFNPEAADSGELSVAIGTNVMALGTPDPLGGSGAVVLYVYSAARHGWGYVGVITGAKISGVEQVRGMGCSCVAVGDSVIVGAKGDAQTPGRVFVLKPPYGFWSYTTLPDIVELAHPQPKAGDGFGTSVAYCHDGTADYVAIGAPGAAPPHGVAAPGQVYIYRGLERSNSPWSTSPISNPDPEGKPEDYFAATVAITPSADSDGKLDGTLTLAVGAPGAKGGIGAAYVGRTKEKRTWTKPFEFGPALTRTFPGSEDMPDIDTEGFGSALAFTGGRVLAVSGPNDHNYADQVESTGVVWLFAAGDEGYSARAEGPLYGAHEGSKFGASLSFSPTSPVEGPDGEHTLAHGEYLLVGAPGVVGGDTFAPACAYRYISDLVDGKPGGLTYTQDAHYLNSDSLKGDKFGAAVSISAGPDGWSLVGAPRTTDPAQDGRGFLFVHSEPAPTWMQPPSLVTTPTLRWAGMPTDWWKKFTPEIPDYLS
jgi:hypothetical protein